ncbi:MAG: acyl--CoA ligase [Bacteroidales bacterium]|jgi:long-chain acyl-CoA synthetase|nr:acyl--CoA ligase [Bacteroidales bacterium]MCR5555450.1 acyl--CoA ligase [Bacteroidales bacterium]
MGNYFFDMIPKEELEHISYLPTIPELLEKMNNDYATRPAVSDTQTTYTYSEFYERIGRRRKFIESLGLPKGAKIAVWDRNSIDAMELYFAITTSGYVVIMLPATLPEPAVLGSIKKFDISAIFVRDEFKPMTSQISIKVCSTADIADTFSPSTPAKKEDLAAIFFTGGTTGMPKGVMLSQGAMMRGSFNGCFMPGSVLSEHRYIALLPLSHIFGMVRGLMSCFYTGALVYSCEDIKTMIGKIPFIKPTCLVLVPGLAEMLLGIAKMKGVGFLGGCLHTIISGAANVPPKLIAEFKELNINLLEGYGLTESANLVSGNKDIDDKAESVGQLYPGQEAKIVDGELWVKGDNIMMGYYGDPEATANALEDGWLKTGDLARFDEEGFLYITGRIKNLILLKNGENISPESIEELFYKHAIVRDCLAKVTTINGNEVIGVEILPRPEMIQGMDAKEITNKMQELVDEANRQLPPFAQIATFSIRTEDFKRTGSLKVDRKNN